MFFSCKINWNYAPSDAVALRGYINNIVEEKETDELIVEINLFGFQENKTNKKIDFFLLERVSIYGVCSWW